MKTETPAPQTLPVKRKSHFREWMESIAIAFVLAMLIRAIFIQAYKIPSGSMQPTLLIGDRLMVNKLRYGPRLHVRFRSQLIWEKKLFPGYAKHQRGDIIVFVYPEDPSRDFIKRLIAFGGETVEIKDGDIYINGKLVLDPRIKNTYYFNRGEFGKAEEKFTVPKGFIYVLGDNSGSSHDSRYWGFVPEENIVGRAQFIYWPFSRMRWIQ